MRFATTILQSGNNTGIEVPPEVLDALGAGRRPAVTVTVEGYTYASTVGARDGRFLLPLSAEHRRASGLAGGDAVEVELVLDPEPRVVEVPPDLRAALAEDPRVAEAFDALSPSRRRRLVTAVDAAKGEDTRRRRVAKAVDDVRTGRA